MRSYWMPFDGDNKPSGKDGATFLSRGTGIQWFFHEVSCSSFVVARMGSLSQRTMDRPLVFGVLSARSDKSAAREKK